MAAPSVSPECAADVLALTVRHTRTKQTVNDILADLRAILAPSGLSSSEIEAALAPALEQYHQTHFTPAAASQGGGGLVTLANEVGPDEYLEPTEGKVFRFDALSGVSWLLHLFSVGSAVLESTSPPGYVW